VNIAPQQKLCRPIRQEWRRDQSRACGVHFMLDCRDQVTTVPRVETEKKSPGDQARSGTKQAAENTCPKCRGSGRIDDKICPDCGGSGKVIEIVGDA
jgi:uncharacterized phage protein